jgi:hypothetical protein
MRGVGMMAPNNCVTGGHRSHLEKVMGMSKGAIGVGLSLIPLEVVKSEALASH